MRTLLLDADILAYKHAAGAQQVTQWPGCEPNVELNPWEEVVRCVDGDVAELVSRLRADKVIVCLSCPTPLGWRKGVLPTYKANRKGVVKPVYLEKIKDYLETAYASFRKPTLEADDIMGILSTHPKLVKGEKVIVSDDKDMGSVPGLWVRPGWVGRSVDLVPREVSEAEADRFHLYQTLVGDPVDGYVGLQGVGPVKANACLDTAEMGLWRAVVMAYELRGHTEADALIQARVARICRASDWCFKRKEVILWTP